MSEEQTEPTTSHTMTIIAGALVLVCLTGAAIALAYAGWDGNAIMGLLTGITSIAVPLVAAVSRLTDLKRATDQQTQVLAKIDHQTNGVLDKRIESGVRKVMNEPIPYHPVSPAP